MEEEEVRSMDDVQAEGGRWRMVGWRSEKEGKKSALLLSLGGGGGGGGRP